MRSTALDKTIVSQPMRPSDLDDVLTIENASFARPWSRKMFMDELANHAATVMVFMIERELVGYLCFWEVVDEGHLLNIAVHPAHRRGGLGSFMMDFLERSCLQRGLSRILLDVARRNAPARNLYKKCGFHTIGFRKNYYAEVQDDALVMEKVLTTPAAGEPQEQAPHSS